MSFRNIANWLIENEGFRALYRALVLNSVAKQLGNRFRPVESVTSKHDWEYLLLCASVLAQSSEGRCQDAALRIAQHCLTSNEIEERQKDAAAVVLDGLANHPAIALAIARGYLLDNVQNRLPAPLRMEWSRRYFENSVVTSSNQSIRVNRFQRAFWEGVNSTDWLSISAPTSAGKSFIFERWITDFLRGNPKSIVVYLVPTRALIYQVENDLKVLLAQHAEVEVNISSLPLKRSFKPQVANVFVFTQERFHIFLTDIEESIRVDVLIVDEAHKVGDGHRGVLLQDIIERVAEHGENTKFLFASPFSKNPEALLQDATEGSRATSIRAEDITVNQNLLFVSQAPRKPKTWSMSLCMNEQEFPLGRIDLPHHPTQVSKRLPFLAHAIAGDHAGNIVYVNGASDAEKTAFQLYDLMGASASVEGDDDISRLIELVEKTIHPRFLLAAVLKRGVAFHYGNMPLLARVEIERLFSIGKIRYLVCTSTLVEGVNMACRNIFLRGPQKGRGKRMSAEDFWNLAGRAGRWGQEFQGNVFCIDASNERIWGEGGPPRSRRPYPIRKTTEEVVRNTDELLAFIIAEQDATDANASRGIELEYVFSYLVAQHIRLGSILESRWAQRIKGPSIDKLASIVEDVAERLTIPTAIVLNNPGISPVAMDRLFRYFQERVKNIEELLPADPASDDAVSSYTAIFSRVSEHFGALGPVGGRSFVLALLVTQWMRGYPLARLISERISYYQRKERNIDVAAVIRSVMEDVEKIARFEAPKYLACYTDVLRYFLFVSNRPDLLPELLDLGVFLEFGVSQPTQISLMALGLSRTSAIAISELITDENLTEAECLSWLRENDWELMDVPELVKRELALVLAASKV